MDEIWKDIPGYEGYYQASDQGRIKSILRMVRHSSGGYKRINKKILKGSSDKDGYLFVSLSKKGYIRKFSIHKLVTLTFLGIRPNKLVVDHYDEDKTNNYLSNLRYVTIRENSSRSIKNSTSKYTGVHWDKKIKKWRASIRTGQKLNNIGYFNNELAASAAYQEALKALNE